jgi:hypothetical protein
LVDAFVVIKGFRFLLPHPDTIGDYSGEKKAGILMNREAVFTSYEGAFH